MNENSAKGQDAEPSLFGAAEITAISHLYRGEVYRSTVWRTRLDATTNWAVLTTSLAVSLTFSSASASPLPLVLVGLVLTAFLYIEARRYRFFDIWRTHAQLLEVNFFGPILRGHGVRVDNGWNEVLHQDYLTLNLHITFFEALGRRLRRTYGWIFVIQILSYLGKLLIHPIPIASLDDLWARAMIGPVPGQVVLLAGLIFHSAWLAVAIATYKRRPGADRAHPPRPGRDPLHQLTRDL